MTLLANTSCRISLSSGVRCLLINVLCVLVVSCLQGCKSGAVAPPTSPITQTPLAVSTTTLAAGTTGVAYVGAIAASGGSGNGQVWTISSGALPAGLSLGSNGTISGTPTAAGSAPFTAKVTDSAGNTATTSLTITVLAPSPLTAYELTGDTFPVHDPSIIRQGSTYYVFVTDALPQSGFIPIRCSTDKIAWTSCGSVFPALPSWIASAVPAATGIWAPDISYFNGTYHLYYAASTFGSNISAIGLATNTTLDATDPSYRWVDQGLVLQSTSPSNFNAIDPNILTDTDGSVWLSYGSFWTGIYQQQIDPTTGKIQSGAKTYHLAQRAASVAHDPIEGASLVQKGSYYYLFVSWDSCCNANPALSNYKVVVGRATSAHGPFLDQAGTDMAAGGGTILLQGDGVNWSAPGGQTAYIDSVGGDLIAFHALKLSQNGLDYLFIRSLSFTTGWPVIGNSTASSGSSATSTTTSLAASATNVTAGNPVTFTATVTASAGRVPAGTVNFHAGSTLLGSATLDASGKGVLTINTLVAGVYSITTTYVGNGSDSASTSPGVNVSVQVATGSTPSSTSLSASATTRLQGLPLSIYAVVTPSTGAIPATGGVTFIEGGISLGAGMLNVTGSATLNTAKLAPGAHSISASYGGDANYQASTSSPLTITITQPASSTYTNPLSLTDPALGAVTSCPDPAIVKTRANSVDTWYLYCTGDAHNAHDLIGPGTLNNRHGISIYHSSDLVNWIFDRDAFASVPGWASAGALMWAPAIKYFNGKFYLYYTVTATTYPGGASAIGVGTSSTAAGPFTDSGSAVILPETVPAGMDSSGSYRWLFDPDVIADSSGQSYILFGSFQGGISVRKLSADGLTSDASSEQLIANDNRYEGAAWLQHGGFYYLFVSATNCCAGPLTGYAVFVGRATSPLGPYLDQQGQSLIAANVGGTPVLAMNGNSLVGPGGGNPFTDESGQDYYLYHAVSSATPDFTGFAGATQRPAALDTIDWVNGWPVARGGFGPSDAASPQPMPASQPNAVNQYTTTLNFNDAPLAAIAALSDDFKSATLSSQWNSLHSMPGYTLTGSSLKMPTVNFDTTNSMASVPILLERAPAGDYIVEASLEMDLPISGSGYDYAQAGLLIYGDDNNYLRLDLYANSDTRQIEFIKAETPPAVTDPTWGATDLGPSTIIAGQQKAWARIAKRTVDGQDLYTGYSSIDGITWLRGGTWTHSLGRAASVGLYAGNRAGYYATFDYVHVSTLK